MVVVLALAAGAYPALPAAAYQWQALPETAPAPADNPTTPAKVELGKMLYFDPRLSADGTVSCFSCHNVMEGGDDQRPTSVGVGAQHGGRNAPTVWNAAFLSVQFWDGRAASLEDQATGPITNPIEMALPSIDVAVERLNKIDGYQPKFEAAFGPKAKINGDTIAKAIAAYERTLITPDTPYDRYVRGDKTALSAQQQRGMQAFADAGCTSCHSGANFSGPALPVGTGFFMKFPTFADSHFVEHYKLTEDGGKAEATGNAADKHMWRVPTLRNLTHTAPYMHNGSVKTIDEAVRVMASTQLNKNLSDAQVADITAFLEALTGTFPAQTMPQLPPTPGDMLE